jgi:hypothetical protein
MDMRHELNGHPASTRMAFPGADGQLWSAGPGDYVVS